MAKFFFEFIEVEIPDFNPEFFDLWLSEVVKSHGKEIGEVSFVFCKDERLLEMNTKYLEHDYLTDVITFNYNDKTSLNGDIFISCDRVKENAIEHGNGVVFDELCRVMAHGVLHLIGFDDKTEEQMKVMRAQEDRCLLLR